MDNKTAIGAKPSYHEEQDRLRRRSEYLRINHPVLYEAARPGFFKSPPSHTFAIVGSWMDSWVYSERSIEDGLVDLCLHLVEHNEKLQSAWSDALFSKRPTPQVIPTTESQDIQGPKDPPRAGIPNRKQG